MLWGISSVAALFLNSAARALPQRDLGDLLPVGPEFDEPVPVTVQTSQVLHSSYTEQASTLSRVENAPSALLQPTTHAAQLTTAETGVSSHPHLTPTQTSTSRPPTPVTEVNGTHTSIIAASASQNAANPTWYPSPPPSPVDSELAQGHAVDWRVIGIAVIAISVVGTMILAVMFFDQWWGFLCDVCGRRRKWQGGDKEELVPDWERGSWDFKVKDGTLPAYPSFGSPPAMPTQEGMATRAQPWKVGMAYRLDHKMSPDLVFPPSWAPKDNGQVVGTLGVHRGPSRQHVVQFPSSDGVTAHKLHSPLSRSNTEKSTSFEDAYDGLAAQ